MGRQPASTSAIERFREGYLEEASELLRELEGALLELEQSPNDPELVGRVFRALHTIKGSGAMFGFDSIASFTHELETVFDRVREGRQPATPDLIGITLDARDHIQELLRAPGSVHDELAAASAGILSRLRQAAPAAADVQPARTDPAPQPEPPAADQRTYRIRFDPHQDIFLSGTNPALLFRDLSQLGDCSLVAHLDRIPQLDAFDPEQCYTHWDAVLTAASTEDAIRDVFIFVEDRARLEVRCIGDADDADRRRLGEILVDRGDIQAAEAEKCLRERPLTGELLVEAGLVSQDRVDAAVLEQRHLDAIREKRQKAEAAATLRVPAAKLDALVNIVGELVTVQARLSSYALASGEPEINFIAEEVERLSGLLRESTMGVRMLPIGETFGRFKRLVRDLSGELGKKIELVTDGDDTELDKTVIEQLNDPLVHLIRNAADHGIEPPEQRRTRGKPEAGTIRLSACHSGAFVLVRVSDDGAGMNRDAIRARAVERGMIAPDVVLTDSEIFALTMAPGFSTAHRVTSVSGRGVGMDVVRRSLDALRGTLSMESTPGRGTVVTLKIPLTLAIIDGLLVEAGGVFFVIPLANISQCIEMERRNERGKRDSLIDLRGELAPFIALRQRFALPGEAPPIEQVIVAETREGKYGLVVDRVIGDHSTVIKKLGSLYRNVEEVSGATILGDGSVALILDVEKIVTAALRDNTVDRRFHDA
ncbi:MAG TPA: chemotaxis protein CheA [Bryobacteraceae bacterium]